MNHLTLSKIIWKSHVKKGDTVIDATAGAGHDTLFLAELALSKTAGSVHALDIQKEALIQTKARLERHLPAEKREKIFLYHRSHETFPETDSPPSLIVYNLGYLPGGNKEKTTESRSTLASLRFALNILPPKGMISLMIYPGHPEGEIEKSVIINWLENLPEKKFYILQHLPLLGVNSPFLITLEKR